VASVTVQSLTKSYGGAVRAVSNLSLDVVDGEFLVVVGPSGCGKSTALRMIAGLEEISGGAVWIGDRLVNNVHPKDRDIAMVFQNYALYPHLTVFNNIAFPLQIAKMPKAEIRDRVHQAAALLELTAYLKRRPGQLSGGQRQRVAMGRAIVRHPAVFLMDEPLSNLDAKLRLQMRTEIARLQRRLGVTTIYVTHDQVEAMTMADRVALMKDGVLQQIGPPREIYDLPKNIFVASFIGSPGMNLLEARLHENAEGGAVLHIGSAAVRVPAAFWTLRPSLASYIGRPIVIGIRPEDIFEANASSATQGDCYIRSVAELVETIGSDNMLYFGLDASKHQVGDPDDLDELSTAVIDTVAATCVARLSAHSQVQMGDPVELAFNLERVHFFDAETGDAIR
jgi:multiple sugar transport system ATP-binding protein